MAAAKNHGFLVRRTTRPNRGGTVHSVWEKPSEIAGNAEVCDYSLSHTLINEKATLITWEVDPQNPLAENVDWLGQKIWREGSTTSQHDSILCLSQLVWLPEDSTRFVSLVFSFKQI